ncbi:hypothetical protein UC8_36940 [Roseimaritima ulvae]|uniref:Thioredoxin domain-containing protein n=2 Tax=Roseimaritima ulvae TaxID=980254 RepID=A0A5B9QRL1_9BACT|nr:hypothetical protein UC8_36940 [Roseimaritima ulvae]
MVLMMAFAEMTAMQQLIRRSGRTLCICAALLGVVATAGCGGETSSPSTGDPQASSGPSTMPAVQRGNGDPAAIRPITQRGGQPGAEPSEQDDPARRVLNQMLSRYRRAQRYSDQGTVQLSYRQNGTPQTDTAPLAVQYESPGLLAVQAYGLQLVCQGGLLSAQVVDPHSSDLDGQRLQQPLAGERLSLDAIYADPIVTQFATAGLGGPPPQLELLFGETPLSGLLVEQSRLSLAAPASLEQHSCHRLRITNTNPPLEYVLWIDRQDLTLRRIELPLALVPGLVDDVTIREAKLTIELTGASFDSPGRDHFRLPPRRQLQPVSRFIPLPPPLDSPLLGRTPPAFAFDAQARTGGFRITAAGSDRQVTVLLWVARHEGSQAAAVGLQEIANSLPQELRDATRFVIVMAEAGGPTDQTLQQWGVELPWVNDTEAVGRDVFGVEQAPTLAVLSSNRQIEWFQHRVEPGAMLALPQVIADVMAGARVGETLRTDHAANQQAYQDAIQQAAP